MHAQLKHTALAVAAVAGLALGATAHADDAPAYTLTANVGLYSNYVFRGLTQTNEKPALQGGFDFGHSSGFYAGTWLSNVSWFSDTVANTTSSLEWDLYAGYKKTLDNGFAFDVGALQYYYPGQYPAGVTKPDTTELYAAVGYKWATLKYSYSIDDTFGVANADGTYYLDFTVAIPLDKFTITAHYGKQEFSGAGNGVFSYDDYKIGVSYALPSSFSVGVAFTDTNAKDAGYTVKGKNLGDNAFFASISRSF